MTKDEARSALKQRMTDGAARKKLSRIEAEIEEMGRGNPRFIPSVYRWLRVEGKGPLEIDDHQITHP